MDIGYIIQFHRKKAGLSRIELALLSGVGKTVIYDLEHGRQTVRFSKLMSVFEVLNIKLTLTSPYMNELEGSDES